MRVCFVFGFTILLLLQFCSPPASAATPQIQTTNALAADIDLIVQLYYGDRERLNQLASQYDLFEFADHDAGYVAARLSRSEYEALIAAGYRIEIDLEQMAAAANLIAGQPGTQSLGIPSYPCYRTVEETYAALNQIATNYPSLATLVDIGDSWEKLTPGGAAGYDLLALVLSNKSRPGPKPRFLLVAEFHARELVTAEAALRFAEELVAGYGVNADLTWLLDYHEIHIVPMVNPDGRKKAEAGQLWRKNTDSDDGCTTASTLGTDLNRNCGFKWGSNNGSSGSPCNSTYRGPASFSEPESQAVRDYVRLLFPDQRGPADTDAAPADTTGLVISLHSYGQLVLYPWGWTNTPPPNATAFKTLGGKFSHFNRYVVQPTIDLYAVSGELNDWVYGELGVPCYTIEMGTTFFQPCADFQNTIYPSNRPALFYAAKVCRQPYLTPAGPDVINATFTTFLSATAASGRVRGFSPLPAAAPITAARYSVDKPSWEAGAVTYPMTAADGNFNSTNETVTASLTLSELTPGRHTVFIEARTGTTNWGAPTAIFITVPPPQISASLSANQISLRWPSTTNTHYTLLHAPNFQSPFTVLASNIVATPPTNVFVTPFDSTGSRFYHLQIRP